MTTARVDKGWKSAGLAKYPVEAIFATLGHYGVAVDEPAFKALGEKHFPLAIASQWHKAWKGTGQFSTFPTAASQELWKRLLPDRLAPHAVTEPVQQLVQALTQMVAGAPDAPVGKTFKAFDDLKVKIPQKDGGALPEFTEEVFAPFHKDLTQAFDDMAEQLAKAGHSEDALAFAQVEEFLFPERAHVCTAMVKASLGQRDEAQKTLEARARDASLGDTSRVMAVDALIHLGFHPVAQEHALQILDAAEKAEQHHLALAMVDRLAHVYKEGNHRQALEDLAPRAERLVAAHNKAHPAHQHGGH